MSTIRVPPAEGEGLQEPVSLEEARAQCRIDYEDEDALLSVYITAAREHAEMVTRRALMTSLWDHTLDGFPSGGAIRLPYPPLIDIESVHYIAPDGEAVEMDEELYRIDTRQEPGLLMPAHGTSWPATRQMPGAVWIRYRAGYEAVPQGLKVAMLMLVGHWFAHREAVQIGTAPHEVPLAVERLLWAHRLYEVA